MGVGAGKGMSQSLCPSIIRTRSCINLLLPSLRLMAFGGTAPKSCNHDGGWVGAEPRRAPSTLFPLIPATRTNKRVQMGHRRPLLSRAASSWRPDAHDARWSKQLEETRLDLFLIASVQRRLCSAALAIWVSIFYSPAAVGVFF